MKKTTQLLMGAAAIIVAGSIATFDMAHAQFGFPQPTSATKSYNYRKARDVDWTTNAEPGVAVSGDKKTITFQLQPGVPNISAVRPTATVEWESGNAKWPSSPHFSAALQNYQNYVNCSVTGTSYGLGQITCFPNSHWIRSLTSEARVDVEVGGAAFGKTKKMLTIVYRPFEGGPFVERLTTPRNPQRGDLIGLRVTLTQNAPSGGKSLRYRLVPSNCFSQAPGGAPYSQNGVSRLDIPAGDRWIDFNVASAENCTANTARFEVWSDPARTNSTSQPWYSQSSFRWFVPRR